MTPLKCTLQTTIFCLSVLFVVNETVDAFYFEDFHLYSDSAKLGFTYAGYSDGWFWGPSDRHPHGGIYDGRHEVLSGEFAAAVRWDNCGSNEAIWLTGRFEYPDFQTNSIFTGYGNPPFHKWNDPSNPFDNIDTAYSFIRDNQNRLEIRIDYEMVDLGEDGFSPLAFTLANESGYIKSEQWVLLVTYTLKNISDSAITGLEFYQLLHAHPANRGAGNFGSYTTANYDDVLADYVPYNPVHQVGRFQYDITQWNPPSYQGDTHVDYIGFSSTKEPDVYEVGFFPHHEPPTTGTYVNVLNRSLNGRTFIENEEAAGAMGWYLGSVDPNETTSLTLAVMFGYGVPSTDGLWVHKYDHIDPNVCGVNPLSLDPEDYKITYTVEYGNDSDETIYNCVLTDYLPVAVDYPVEFSIDENMNIVSSDPNYNFENHTYVWNLGDLGPYESGSKVLIVYANTNAEPGGQITNEVILSSDSGWVKDTETTPVCCWDDGRIYVDQFAVGANTGISWENAYTDLQSALARAARGCGGEEIWVAAGWYSPGTHPTHTFKIPDGVSVYGGFAGWETSLEQRILNAYPSILSGYIEGSSRNKTVVTMGHETLLDGFTIRDADEEGEGVGGQGIDFHLENCVVEKNRDYGIRTINCNMVLRWCNIRNNDSDGILHQGTDFVLVVENCWIRQNMRHGIGSIDSTPFVRNSIISESDLSEAGNAGIHIMNPAYPPILHNITFAHNRSAGISFTDNHDIYGDPNNLDYPDIQNCILWYNNNDGDQFSGFGKEHFRHSCIYDPNDPTGESVSFDLNYNFSTNPRLAYVDPNNVRIRFDSPCRDMGNPFLNYDDQLDMDAKDRVYGMAVDIGAYEVVCGDVSNTLDWNADGLVNLHEFNLFSLAWLTYDPNHPYCDPNHPSYVNDPNLPGYISETDKLRYNPLCDLDDDLHVGLSDLLLFLDAPWLWKACWVDLEEMQMQQMMPGGEMMLMGESESMLSSAVVTSEPIVQEKSAEEQILDLATAIVFLEQLWFEEPDIQQEINADDWQRFMDAVYQNLLELQAKSDLLK